jgi:hypothetical protein
MPKNEDYKVLNVSETAFKDFQKISKIPAFKKIDDFKNKHLFMIAVGLGFKHNKYSLINKKHTGGYCREDTLDEEDRAIIKAITVNKKRDINALGNIKEQYQIAENYANGGIVILKEIVNQPGDFFVNLSKEL